MPAANSAESNAGGIATGGNTGVARAFLDGVSVAAVVLTAVVSLALARTAFVDLTSAALGLAAAILVGLLRWNSSRVMACAAAAGWLIFR